MELLIGMKQRFNQPASEETRTSSDEEMGVVEVGKFRPAMFEDEVKVDDGERLGRHGRQGVGLSIVEEVYPKIGLTWCCE